MVGMRRREVITLLGSAAVRPLAGRAQLSGVSKGCSLHLREQNRARAVLTRTRSGHRFCPPHSVTTRMIE
jgi:hypothetical protein